MNAFSALMKILAAAAVIAGAVFAVIMYGDKLMALTKKLLGQIGVTMNCPCEDEGFVDESELAEEPVAADQDFEG